MKQVFRMAWAMSFVLLISGCGGGGGGSSKPPVSNNSSSTSSSSSLSNISSSLASSASSISSSSSSLVSSSIPASTQLTINGAVAVNALAGGEIVFTIGSVTYKAKIDDSLKYRIALDIPTADSSKPFVAIATGSTNDSWVQLAALYPSVSFLAQKAGDDRLLSSDEYFGINITALSTAEYAEIINKQLSFANDAERKTALLSLHPVRAMEQAAMLSRLITDINQTLPIQTKTTLDYLLDANLAETYLEALRLADAPALKEHLNLIRQDSAQVNVSSTKWSGHYFLEALNSQYSLTMNEDGTGKLVTGNMFDTLWDVGQRERLAADITWVRKGKTIKINFTAPVKYRVAYYRDENENWFGCDQLSTVETEFCELQFDSVQLDLISESDFHYLAKNQIAIKVFNEKDGAILFEGIMPSQLARLIKSEQFLPVTAADLIGAEWVSNEFSYIFSADGKVKQKKLTNSMERELNWTLENNHVLMEGTEIWITHKEEIGFSIVHIEGNNVYRSSLFKRSAVTMSETDWVGRWSSSHLDMFATAYDVNADKTWRDGFESESAGSWSIVNEHRQTAVANASWRMNRDVLAIKDGKYYLSTCQGRETERFFVSNCYLSVESKDINFATHIFWNNWSFPSLNEKVSGRPWISMEGAYAFTESPSTITLNSRSYQKVSATKIYNYIGNRIIEIISASKNEVVLCEYALGFSCDEDKKLTYQRGIEVKLSVNSGGVIYHQLYTKSLDHGYTLINLRQVDKILMAAKNRPLVIRLNPYAGYSYDSDAVSGCDGELIGNEYHVPNVTAACEITVNYKK